MSEIPEGWTATELGRIINDIADGGTPSTSNSDFFGGEIPWVVIDDIQPHIFDTKTKITDLGLAKSSAKLWGKETLILSTGATIGRVGIAIRPMATKQGICGIVPIEEVDNNYFFHYLVSIEKQLNMLSQGSTIKETRPPTVKKVRIELPPLPEQKKIASILTSVDDAIENIQKQIDKLQDLKKATMNELLTKGIGHTKFKDSELWHTYTIGELGNFYGGLTGKTAKDFGSGEPFITYMQVFSQTSSSKEEVNFVQISEEEKQPRVEYGDILFTTSSETPNEVGMTSVFLDTDWSPYLNSFCFGLRPSSDKCLDPIFAQYFLRGSQFRENIRPLAQGSTRYNLSKKSLKKLSITIPPLPEQKKIAPILTSIDDAIEQKQAKLRKTQSLKKALMQDLLTGKVRVKAANSVR